MKHKRQDHADVSDIEEAGASWCLVQTQPGKEHIAAENLKRQGFATFIPWALKTVQHARRITERKAAFFPNYIFVSIDFARHRWRSINSTIGVTRLVKSDGIPSRAPHGLVEDLMALCENDGVFNRTSPLSVGERVEVVSGPLADRIATVAKLRDADRIEVLLSIMNRSVTAELPIRDLRPIHRH